MILASYDNLPLLAEEQLNEANEHVSYFRERAQDLEDLASDFLKVSERSIQRLLDGLELDLKSSALDEAMISVILGMNIVNDSFHALWSTFLTYVGIAFNKAINRFKDLLDKHNLG
jgi:hypothetical protein